MSDSETGAVAGLEALQNRLDAHRTKLDNLADDLQEERERREELEDELRQRDRRIAELERQLAELDSRTDLLDLVQNADDVDGRQRSVALIQHLKRQAESGAGTAGVTREAAEKALHHPDVDRTTIYDDMRRAARLVDDEDVCWYADGKLRLDLGELPEGVDLAQRVSEVVG